MTSKDQSALENHVCLDDIIQPNGLHLPLPTNLSELDFEFFSDEEDNTCIVVDTIIPSVAEQKVVSQPISQPSLRSDSKEYDLPQDPKQLQDLTMSLPCVCDPNHHSIMIQTDTKTIQSMDGQTQTHIREVNHIEMNTVSLQLSHTEVQTDPVNIQEIDTEQQSEEVVKPDLTTKEGSVKAIPTSTSTPLPIDYEEKVYPTAQTESKPIRQIVSEEDEIKSTIAQPDTSTISPSGPNKKFDFITDPMNMKISFLEFAVGDIALFVPVDEKKENWMAFHSNRPHRYLAKESLDIFLAKDKQRGGRDRSRILGRIIFIDSHITSADENPYHLTLGTLYHICYIEPLLVPKKKRTPGLHQSP